MKTLILRLANETESQGCIGLANEIAVDEAGWALIPYGEWNHSGRDGRFANAAAPSKGVVQRFDKEAATEIVRGFKSVWSRLKRAVVGLPVFKGHPDAPRFAASYPDKTPRGTIADMEARDNGLAVKMALTPQGGADVEDGHKFISPYWDARKVGESATGAVIASPFKLHSIGLVLKGNIPGLSLTNTSEDPNEISNQTMKALLIKLLAQLGVTLANEADDAAVTAAVESACGQVAVANAAEVEVAENGAIKKLRVPQIVAAAFGIFHEGVKIKDAKIAELETKMTLLTNSAETEKTRANTADAAFKAERKERALLLANAAITEGRLSAAERDTVVTALCNNFETESVNLSKRTKALKTTRVTGELNEQTKVAADRREKVLGLVNDFQAANPKATYEEAFAAVQKDPKNAALFDAMKKPEVTR